MKLEDHVLNMQYCIKMARENADRGQYPIAAIVVDKDGHVLAGSCSSLREKNDPTNHPEMEAIRKAAETKQSRVLSGCYLYSTLEPCPMCTSAAIWSKMQGIVFGAYQEDAINFVKRNPKSKFSWRQIDVKCKYIIEHGIPKLEVQEGILRNECKTLFQ